MDGELLELLALAPGAGRAEKFSVDPSRGWGGEGPKGGGGEGPRGVSGGEWGGVGVEGGFRGGV